MKQVVQYWLSQLCRSKPEATQAAVCLSSPDTGHCSSVAFWPEGSVSCLAILCLVRGDCRVTGTARLEAGIQRPVVTPQDGFIATAAVRPGNIVRSGDVLGSLDDKDLRRRLIRIWSHRIVDRLRLTFWNFMP